MDQLRTAPPAADSCLVSSYASRGAGQKGGTLVHETVLDQAAHEARLKDPASYRPAECRCGCTRLHLHDYRDRKLRGSGRGRGAFTIVTVVVFLCAKCRATWRVLPAFLARCLWRNWAVVAMAVGLCRRRADEPEVPSRTRQRWCARLAQAARVPMQVLASSGEAALREVAQNAGLEGSRRSLVDRFAVAVPGVAPLAALAELLHRLSPGIRLM